MKRILLLSLLALPLAGCQSPPTRHDAAPTTLVSLYSYTLTRNVYRCIRHDYPEQPIYVWAGTVTTTNRALGYYRGTNPVVVRFVQTTP